MKYFKNIELVTQEDAYQKMKNLYSNDSDLINKINIDDLQEYITAGCYYLDDITLLDENSYFEKIKADINDADENKIISNIVTIGIIDLYNQEGIEGVNNYIEKSNKANNHSDTSLSTNKTLNTESQAENITQKIMNNNFFDSGKITKIDDNNGIKPDYEMTIDEFIACIFGKGAVEEFPMQCSTNGVFINDYV